MGSTRRSFTEEYKDQAVAFVIEGNRSVADVARNIGVHEMTLGKWVKKTRDSQREQIPPDAELTGSERLELIRLRAGLKDDKATIAELQMQVEFAKKSGDLVRERQAVKFAAIADWADSNSYPVAFHVRRAGGVSLGLLRLADGRSVPAFEGRHHPYCDHEEAPCGGPRESGRPSPSRRPGRLAAPAVSQACLAPHEGRWPARTPSEGVETHDHRWG